MAKQNTKAAILAAARKLFVKYGYAATSISMIETLAKVNHSLIFHHFGNKQKLWIAVKQDIVLQTKATQQALPSHDQPLPIFIKKLFHNHMLFYRENPDIVSMINWQRVDARDELDIGITHSKEVKAWLTAIKHYQETEEINPKLKPEFIMTMIVSLISAAALDPNIFIKSKTAQNAYMNFCAKSIIKICSN